MKIEQPIITKHLNEFYSKWHVGILRHSSLTGRLFKTTIHTHIGLFSYTRRDTDNEVTRYLRMHTLKSTYDHVVTCAY
jgi:hypothetical protein